MIDSNTDIAYKPKTAAFILLGLLILGASIATFVYWSSHKPEPQRTTPPLQLPFVTIVPVELSDNAVIIESNGFIDARYKATITPQVSGMVNNLSDQLSVGQSVNKDDVLVTLDDSDYTAAVANARANLASAKSQFAQEQAKSRQAARDAKRLGIKATRLSLRKPQLEAAQSAINNATAQLKLAKTNLSRTVIKAPFDAMVTARHISPGEWANATKPLANIVSLKQLTVTLTMSYQDSQLINIGNLVKLHLPASDQYFTAKVSRIAPEFNTTNRTINVYIDIDNPLDKYPLPLNTYLSATITGQSITNSQWIPTSAISNNQWIWHKKSDDTIEKVPVTVIYSRQSDALVVFSKAIDDFIERPKDNFANGDKVTTQQHMNNPSETNKSSTSSQTNKKNHSSAEKAMPTQQ